nr:DUF397 domain-containing protein [Streptomyces sp. SID10853]
MTEAAWFKSSYSNDQGGACLEVADLRHTRNRVAVRDSKDPNGPVLTFDPSAFVGFVDGAAAGRFDI